MQAQIMELVKSICNTESTNCRSLNKSDLARKLLDLANVPTSAIIQEIPLDWNNQVVVLFLLPNDNNYYSLFAGIGNDCNFHFELTITGILKDHTFNFYDDEKEININYFTTYEIKEGNKKESNVMKERIIKSMQQSDNTNDLNTSVILINHYTNKVNFYNGVTKDLELIPYNIFIELKESEIIKQELCICQGDTRYILAI